MELIGGFKTPIPICPGTMLCVHLIPQCAFLDESTSDIRTIERNAIKAPPLVNYERSVRGWDHHFNLDGVLSFRGAQFDGFKHTNATGYCQLFRNGVVEGVATRMVGYKVLNKEKVFHIAKNGIENYLAYFHETQIPGPYWLFVTLIGMKDVFLQDPGMEYVPPCESDIVEFPEVKIECVDDELGRVTRPVFDTLWNLANQPSCTLIDEEGHFKTT